MTSGWEEAVCDLVVTDSNEPVGSVTEVVLVVVFVNGSTIWFFQRLRIVFSPRSWEFCHKHVCYALLSPLSDTVTWCWRTWRRCGRKSPRAAKGRRSLNLWIRTGTSLKCSSGETLSLLCWGTRSSQGNKHWAFWYFFLFFCCLQSKTVFRSWQSIVAGDDDFFVVYEQPVVIVQKKDSAETFSLNTD